MCEERPVDKAGSVGGAQDAWDHTLLGPASGWPQSLRTSVSLCLASPLPLLICWGPALVMLYNDAFRPLLGPAKHRLAMGQPALECWPELASLLGPMLQGALRYGESKRSEDQVLEVGRDGFHEPRHFTFSCSPIRDESGGIGGVFTAAIETTERVRAERRASEQERRREETLAELDRAGKLFATNLAHELRTSLTLILGPAENLLAGDHGPLTDEQREEATLVQRSARRLLALVEAGRCQAEGAPLPDGLFVEPAVIEEAAPSPRPGAARILVADDNDDMRAYLVRVLSPRWRVEAVPDGAAALASARARPPDLVLSDVLMPKVDGIGLVRALREDPRTQALPVILLSVRGAEYARVAGLEAGADDYLIKPFSARELCARVGSQIELRLRAEIAESARLYAASREAKIKADEASRLKDEFLSVVSHELRTPLTAILGWTRLLRASAEDRERTSRGLDVIDRNAGALIRLVDDILDASRIVTDKIRIDPRPLEVEPLVRAAVEALQPGAQAKGLTLAFTGADRHAPDGAPRRPVIVLGDAERLQQVVWNLVSNSMKFTLAGGRIEVRLTGDAGSVSLEVSDTGAGISPDFLPFVFDRFRQADSSSTRAHGGLGLGLAIVRSIVELHDGTVRAESAGVGCGATLRVTLPILHEVSALGADLRPARVPARLDGIKVLLVDDEHDTRELVAMVLVQQGAHVTVVGSAREALEVLRDLGPDVLISDICMPGEDGLSLLRRVRALNGPERDIPAIALTACAHDEDNQRAQQAGFQRHVAKPIEPATLTAMVASLTGRAVA